MLKGASFISSSKSKLIAQHPYQDLQIRVCGWNVLFNNINREEQDGFIRQAKGLV